LQFPRSIGNPVALARRLPKDKDATEQAVIIAIQISVSSKIVISFPVIANTSGSVLRNRFYKLQLDFPLNVLAEKRTVKYIHIHSV
jgi:hypothetical protein